MKMVPLSTGAACYQWSTEGIPTHEKLDFWTGAICEAYFRLECSSSTSLGFEGLLERVTGAGLSYTRMEASSQTIRNVPSAPNGCKDAFYLVTDRAAPWALKQFGRVRQLRSGDMALIDVREPYQIVFHQGAAVSALELPCPWLRTHLSAVDFKEPLAIERDAGWGRMLSSLCVELSKDLALVEQVSAQWLADHLGGLLGAALEPGASRTCARDNETLFGRAQQMLNERLSEAGLTAVAVAQALGVSVRSLHRAFAARGTSFADALRATRLQAATRLLQRRDLSGLTVAEICVRCGFRDPSHFSRVFQSCFGKSPSTWSKPPNAGC
jgi:AraC-like DNA-binding protein